MDRIQFDVKLCRAYSVRVNRWYAWLLGGMCAFSAAPSAFAAETVLFPHDDEALLDAGQRRGGAAFLPSGTEAGGQPLPLVVFLHGTNASGTLHLWLGGGGRDLRPIAESLVLSGIVPPFVLAGPSQTRSAALARRLWSGVDLARFTSDVRDALATRVVVDDKRIFLVGHSGAGCNPSGGLASSFRADERVRPAAVVAIDPCLDRGMGQAFALQSPDVPLWLYWQTDVWQRDMIGWVAATSARSAPSQVRTLFGLGTNPHDAIVPAAFALAVRELLARPSIEE